MAHLGPNLEIWTHVEEDAADEAMAQALVCLEE